MKLHHVEATRYEIELDESFDFESHKNFRQHVKDALSHRPQTLDINFNKVDYVDSSALGMLLLAKQEADHTGTKLRLTGVKNGHAKSALQLVGFDSKFTIVG